MLIENMNGNSLLNKHDKYFREMELEAKSGQRFLCSLQMSDQSDANIIYFHAGVMGTITSNFFKCL